MVLISYSCMFVFAGWCCAVIPRRAGKVSNLWRPQEEAVRFSPNHRPTVCNFSHKQQSTLGSGGWCFQNEILHLIIKWLLPQSKTMVCIIADVAFVITRWSTMTHAEEVRAIGTVCSGLNIWPQVAIWLQRWVRCVSVDYPCSLCSNRDKHKELQIR